MAEIRGMVPFGEFKPDLRYLANNGLLRATNVIPVYGNYVTSPKLERVSGQLNASATSAFGMHIDRITGNAYIGAETSGGACDIYKVTPAGVVSIVSKAPAAYVNADNTSGWQGASFGENIIMTNVTSGGGDPVQYLAPGAALFADMITSTFKPRGRFVFPLRNNLFLANCYVPVAYDGLAMGSNPTLVAWSRSDDIRQFGSFNADPQIIGSGYQPLNFDIGDITGAVSCGSSGEDYAIVAFSNGLVRVDGPPYSFRVISRNSGTLYPNSLCAIGPNVCFWGAGGVTRMLGGEGEPEVLGAGKWLRYLLDDTTGISEHPAQMGSSNILDVSMAYDSMNDLLFVCYTANGTIGASFLVYNIGEDRASYFTLGTSIRYLKSGRLGNGSWCPGRDLRFIEHSGVAVTNFEYLAKMVLGEGPGPSILSSGLISLKAGLTTRITRIRPIYTATTQDAVEQISCTIESTNKPYGALRSHGPYTSVDRHGWITTPTTSFADWHAITFTVAAGPDAHKIVEYEAFEYEGEEGGVYAA